MTRDARIEKLTRRGIELMRRERGLALKGDIGALSALNEEKVAFLGNLEALGRELEAGGPASLRETKKRELATLFEIIRRRAEENQALLKAAEAGVRSAGRRIREIFELADENVAYNQHGERVESKARSTKTSEFL